MNIKDSANPNGVKGVIWRALADIESLMEATGEFTVTCMKDSHEDKPRSLHNFGLACDIRTHHISEDQVLHVISQVKSALPGFTVIYEGDGTPNAHCHIQVDLDWLAKHGDPRINS